MASTKTTKVYNQSRKLSPYSCVCSPPTETPPTRPSELNNTISIDRMKLLFVSLLLFFFGGEYEPTCAFSARRHHRHQRTYQRRHPLWAVNDDAIITDADQQPIPTQRWQHPSQPEPDYATTRKEPLFPGAIPIESQDITACINQIGQTSPANVLLGKPKFTMCKYGYAQAFSLNPMPRTFRSGTSEKNKQPTQRFNSGLKIAREGKGVGRWPNN